MRLPTVLCAIVVAFAFPAGAMAGQAVEDLAASYPPPRLPPVENQLSLGAILVTSSPSWSHLLKVGETKGALIVGVLPGSPAEAAGLVVGDVIVAVDDTEVSGVDRVTVLFRSDSRVRHILSLSGADGTPHRVDVELSAARLSPGGYLRRRLGETGDIATKYLYAQVSGNPAEALGLAELILDGAPDFALAHALRGRLLLEASRPSEGARVPDEIASAAKQAVERAIELDPGSSDIRRDAAVVYLRLNDIALAESAALAAVERDPVSVNARYILATTRLIQSRPDAALPELHRALELDPFDRKLYVELARNYRTLGLPAAAEATEETLRRLASRQEPGPRGAKVTSVALTVLVMALLVGALSLIRWPASTRPTAEDDRGRRWTAQPVALAETLAALGVWTATLPWTTAMIGLSTSDASDLAVTDHLVPGLLIVVISLTCLLRLMGRDSSRKELAVLAAIPCLAGAWVTATDVGVLSQALGHDLSWRAALLHSAGGPLIVVTSVLLCRLLAEGAPTLPQLVRRLVTGRDRASRKPRAGVGAGRMPA